MKKYLLMLFIIIAIAICILLIKDFLFKYEVFTPILYRETIKQNDILNISLQANDLKITLKGLYTDKINYEQFSSLNLDEATIDNIKRYSENSNYSLLVDFSTIGEYKISQPIFDYIVYDNSGNVIMSSIIYRKDSPNTNKFLKYFMEKEHHSDNMIEFSDYILSSNGTSVSIVNNTDKSNLVLICSSIDNNEQKILDLSKIHILILNPSYMTNNSNNRIYLDDTIFEFILEN